MRGLRASIINRRHPVLIAAVLLFLVTGCAPVGKPPASQPPIAPTEPGNHSGGQTSVPSIQPDVTPGPTPGAPAPDVVATDVRTGEVVKLSDLRGKSMVLLNFWATWCGPCRMEMPDLERLQHEMKDKVRIIAVGGDPTEAARQLKSFATDLELTFSVVHDGGAAGKAYKTIGFPTTFAIDSKGIVREKVQGAMSYDQMKSLVAQVQAAEAKP